VKQGDTVVHAWSSPQKSTDLISFETILRLTLGGIIDPYASGSFDSQFQDLSDPNRPLSFTPVRLKESAGGAHRFIDKTDQTLQSRLGITFRQSLRRYFPNPAPDATIAHQSTNDGGFELVTDAKRKILENRVVWSSKLIAYLPVYYSGKSALDRQTGIQLEALGLPAGVAKYTLAPDLDWENIFTTQITKLISVNLYTRWIYDKYDNSVKPALNADGTLSNSADVSRAIRLAGQFKQTMSIGITYRFL
jgi:hypothetical protein